jgi:predicted transcriptional regulator
VAAKKKKQRIGKGASRKKQESSLQRRLIKAMTNPLRYQLLTRLNDREWSPNELSEELAEGLSQVSYHIKVLRDFGLIEMTKTRPAWGSRALLSSSRANDHLYGPGQRHAEVRTWDRY